MQTLGHLRSIWLGRVFRGLSPIKNQSQPTSNNLLWEKVAATPLSTYFFLGLGWPWVGEFVGFIIILKCFHPTQHNFEDRKQPIAPRNVLIARASKQTKVILSTCQPRAIFQGRQARHNMLRTPGQTRPPFQPFDDLESFREIG